MKILSILMMLLLVFAFTGSQDVRADERDEAYNTGQKYYNGEGVKQDYIEAFKWFRQAADQGSAKAQNAIALMYYNGHGITQNYPAALSWFVQAAVQGYAQSQHNVGAMYHEGQGVTKDRAEAIKWLSKAADQGYQKSKDALLKIQAATPSSPQHTGLSLADTGNAWKEASMSARTALCKTIARDYGSGGLTNDYKYWLYNIDDFYRTSGTLGLSIERVVNTIDMQILIKENQLERQKYLGR
jgi:TPR repeat protein